MLGSMDNEPRKPNNVRKHFAFRAFSDTAALCTRSPAAHILETRENLSLQNTSAAAGAEGDTMATTIYNQAQLSYNGAVINSNTVAAELFETLEITKTPVNQTYSNGDRVSYVINLVNRGTTPFIGMTVTDNLGEYSPAVIAPESVRPLTYVEGTATYFVNDEFSQRPAVTSEDPLTVTGLDLPAGGRAALIYEATVNDFAPLDPGGEINNVVTVTGAGISEDVRANAVITADSEPQLSIVKSVSPALIPENGRVTYTFTVENMGNTPAADTVIISDTFDPPLSDMSVTLDGTPIIAPTDYVYDQTTGIFETVAGVITVPAASYTPDTRTGATVVTPGSVTVTVSGTV